MRGHYTRLKVESQNETPLYMYNIYQCKSKSKERGFEFLPLAGT